MSVSRTGSKPYSSSGHDLPDCPAGLEHISRYWDKRHRTFAAKLLPGEYYVSIHNELICTVLGSCISACIRDVRTGVGGMNHFMLPLGCEEIHSGKEHLTSATRYGNFAMEMLINGILKHGGNRKNMEVKIFGGGKVLASMSGMDIGLNNIEFVHDYLRQENMRIVAEDVGDIHPRKVLYFPETGRVRVKKLINVHNSTISDREKMYRDTIERKSEKTDIELF